MRLYLYPMGMPRLPPRALWEVIKTLSETEYRQLKEYIRGTKLEWLLQQLRQMNTYDEQRLYARYLRKFPQAQKGALRTYKYQLWDALAEVLPAARLPKLENERSLWRKLWLSIALWEYGQGEIAFVLWQQAMYKAIEYGWEEIALWGLRVLETYVRDFHFLSPQESITTWSEALLNRTCRRYQALLNKFSAMESHLISRQKRGVVFPTISEEDSWGSYFEIYAQMLHSAEVPDMEKTLHRLLKILNILIQAPHVPSPYYVRYRLAMNYLLLGVPLLHTTEKELFELWLAGWGKIRGIEMRSPLADTLEMTATTLKLAFHLRWGMWKEASSLCTAEIERLTQYVLSGGPSLMARPLAACAVFLALLLHPEGPRLALSWYNRINPWMEEMVQHDSVFIRWRFLRWYAAFRLGEKRLIHYWYRKLREAWRSSPTQVLFGWKAVLRALRGISPELYGFQRRRLEWLLRYWGRHPAEEHFWHTVEAIFFPMPHFIQSLLWKKPLEAIQIDITYPQPLGAALRCQTEEFLKKLIHSPHLSH
ncbi:MAG: hypothetical protein NZZ60_06155 [Bacteroidia bacterium]|nr:hypothetical protein [Bacteroidia bacterium]MDW8417387.1 hypothetical protein [Bacteroidia bacterium]